ncbi:hypothetical protein [Lysinibacillus xylanilyticus]|uniref:hypothetical protein n=1 Tax=Lysinibacillus xylanilyticus TaxID=582475 RepID=UPI003CFD2355
MLVNQKSDKSIASLIGKSELLKFDEVFFILKDGSESGYSERYFEDFKREYTKWFKQENYDPNEFYLNFRERAMQKNFGGNILKTYIVLNMMCKIIPYDTEFVEEIVYVSYKSKFKLFYPLYRFYPNKFLANIDSIHQRSNIKLSLLLFLRSEFEKRELTEDEILKLFFQTNKRTDSNYKLSLHEFSDKIYPQLVKYGYFAEYNNIQDYITRIKRNMPIDLETSLYEHLEKQMGIYKDSEFYAVAKSFINDKFTKKTLMLREIKASITMVSKFVELCITNKQVPIMSVRDISGFHRDYYIEQNQKANINHFKAIRSFLRHYNSFFVNDGEFYDVSLFSSKYVSKKPKIADKTALKENGIGALAASIFSEIIYSRNTDFEKKNQIEKQHYITLRTLWLTLLSGGRFQEISKLNLIAVENSLNYKSPYIVLHTVKGGNNRTIEFERGQENEGIFEYDWISIDILKESVAAARSIYKGNKIKPEQMFLFPGFRVITKPIGYLAVTYLNKKIQAKNMIVHGSIYDILDREAYLNNPGIREKLDEPLFTLRSFRHFSVEILRKYARLTQIEIQKFTGHRLRKSENHYGEHFLLAVETFKVMEEHGHLYGENKLVPNQPIHLDTSGEDKSNIAFIQDVNNYFNDNDYFSSVNLNSATKVIDEETDCHTIVACGDTGIGCISCEYFQAGEETIIKRDAIRYLIEYEYNQIELLINELMIHKKELMKKIDASKTLLANKFIDICIRFEKINLSKEVTLMSNEQGFGWSESTANKFLNSIYKGIRKIDLDTDIIKRIKEIYLEGFFEEDNIDISLYRDTQNKVAFRHVRVQRFNE